MSRTLFISDLHLHESRPEATELFLDLLKGEAAAADALYILGDLFEYWLGDDVATPLSGAVADALAALAQGGTPCHFIHGNRDFLLGERFADQAHMRLLPEESVIDLYGERVLLMHGDQLCTDDVGYQKVRAMVRTSEWQAALLAKSPAERMAFAQQARKDSQTHQQGMNEMIMDVNAEAVEAAFRRHDVRTLIHGHTHRPAIHNLRLDGANARRIVLGDWYAQGSVLRAGPGNCQLETLALRG